MPSSAFSRQDALSLLRVCAVALVIRLAVVACVFGDTAANTLTHEAFGWEVGWTARSLAAGRGFSSPYFELSGPTALVPPLYTWLVAAVFRLLGTYSSASAIVILSLNCIFSTLTCLPVFHIMRRLFNRRVAGWAAWAWALYPFAIYFSAGRVWEYALTSLLFTSALALAIDLQTQARARPWIALGALIGVATLTNPSVLPSLGLLILWTGWRLLQCGGPALRNVLLACVSLTVVVMPWSLRNLRVLHTTALVRDGFWLEFWAGNNGDLSDSNVAWVHPADNPVEMARYKALGETAYLNSVHRIAIAYASQHPGFVIASTGRRFLRFWTGFWSFSKDYVQRQPLDLPNVPFCTAVTLFMLLGIRRLLRLNSAGAAPFLLVLIVYPLPYYLTHSSMDYRQPVEPVVVMLCTIFGVSLSKRNRNALQNKDPDPATQALSATFTRA